MSTLLIVDDEPGLLALLSTLLSEAGYTVLTAGDGVAALSVLGSAHVDLVVSDVMMPRMGGPELMKAARKAGHRVPFLFESSLPEHVVRTLVGAGSVVLTKPFRIDALLQAVRRHLPAA